MKKAILYALALLVVGVPIADARSARDYIVHRFGYTFDNTGAHAVEAFGTECIRHTNAGGLSEASLSPCSTGANLNNFAFDVPSIITSVCFVPMVDAVASGEGCDIRLTDDEGSTGIAGSTLNIVEGAVDVPQCVYPEHTAAAGEAFGVQVSKGTGLTCDIGGGQIIIRAVSL